MKIKYIFYLVLIAALGFGTVLHAPSLYASGQQQDVPGPESSASLNWAGYVADSGSNYTSVTGSWVVPTVTASAPGRADATWVGIGGVNAQDLLQAGTEAMVNSDGSVTYQAWYETLPNVSIPVALDVSPGDSMTTTLTEGAANQWHVTIRNNTTNKVYTKTVLYDSSHSSAEWVEERVSDIDGSFWPLDNFGSVTFFNSFATQNGQEESLTQLGAQPLTMVGTHQVLATTSGIDSTGRFTVTRSDTSTAVAGLSYDSAPVPQQVVDTSSPGASYIVITFGPDGVSISHSDDGSNTQNTNLTPVYTGHHHHSHDYYSRW